VDTDGAAVGAMRIPRATTPGLIPERSAVAPPLEVALLLLLSEAQVRRLLPPRSVNSSASLNGISRALGRSHTRSEQSVPPPESTSSWASASIRIRRPRRKRIRKQYVTTAYVECTSLAWASVPE
jgi:hypothetical protein